MNDNVPSPFDDLRCFLCRKELRNTTQLGVHNIRFHLEKGKNLYKCDNCDDKFTDKHILGQHITEYHISCSMCKKVFPDGNSLSYHIEAVHGKLKQKHTIEKESRMRIHIVKIFNGIVQMK